MNERVKVGDASDYELLQWVHLDGVSMFVVAIDRLDNELFLAPESAFIDPTYRFQHPDCVAKGGA